MINPRVMIDPRVDQYIDQAEPFARPILRHLRELFHQACPKATETIKWSKPVFVQEGVILGHLAAFKHHCSLGFWGSQMRHALGQGGFEGSGAMGSLGPLKSLDDLPADAIVLGYMRMAGDLVENDVRTKSLDHRRGASSKRIRRGLLPCE